VCGVRRGGFMGGGAAGGGAPPPPPPCPPLHTHTHTHTPPPHPRPRPPSPPYRSRPASLCVAQFRTGHCMAAHVAHGAVVTSQNHSSQPAGPCHHARRFALAPRSPYRFHSLCRSAPSFSVRMRALPPSAPMQLWGLSAKAAGLTIGWCALSVAADTSYQRHPLASPPRT
jgi:hypothetical protein